MISANQATEMPMATHEQMTPALMAPSPVSAPSGLVDLTLCPRGEHQRDDRRDDADGKKTNTAQSSTRLLIPRMSTVVALPLVRGPLVRGG